MLKIREKLVIKSLVLLVAGLDESNINYKYSKREIIKMLVVGDIFCIILVIFNAFVNYINALYVYL